MSRLDWFTIAVVAICLAAIIFLLSRAMGWESLTGDTTDPTELIEKDVEDLGLDVDSNDLDTDSSDISLDDASGESGIDSEEDDMSAMEGESGDSFDNDDDSSSEASDDSDFDSDVSINTSPSQANGDYLVIAGSFSLMHNAENFAKKLQKQGYSNAYVGKFNAGKFASVIVDSFDSGAEASAMVKELKAAGIEAFSKRKK